MKNGSDLHGAGRLTIDAIIGIIDLVEDLHHTIAGVGGVLSPPGQHRTTGITGLVYRNIRAVSGLAGTGINRVLEKIGSRLEKKEPGPRRQAMLATLNGVLGDHLAASGNPLAIPMQLRKNGAPLSMAEPAFSKALGNSCGKIAIMVHGSCMNDLQWNRRGHDHGAALAHDLGYLPIYLLYNSGLHVSENGQLFSRLMETFMNELPRPMELVIIGHSMGGLVSRSACHYGKLAGHSWINHLSKLVFLGTPHHGSPLERGGNRIDVILGINPYSAPFSRLGKIRSAGVTDLRYGNLLHEDWKDRDRFEHSRDRRVPVPLPDGVRCYAAAATIAKNSTRIGDHLIGDGLVPLNSALGRHENPDLNLLFPDSRQWIGREMSHWDLLNHPEVFQTIRKWLKTDTPSLSR